MLKGLANLGNTCSINTLVQCLGHCPIFLNFILNTNLTIQKIGDRHYSVYEELKEVLKILWIENKSIIPKKFIKAFYESVGSGYRIGDQHDLTEMWMLLLDNIIHETHDPSFISKNTKIQECLNKYFKNSQSPLIDLLYGCQTQQVTCDTCNHYCENHEPIAISHINTSFIELFETQPIHEWKCEKCSASVDATKRIHFWKLPTIWMIIIQRYDGLATPIDILPFLEATELSTKIKIKYELKAIANHYGTLENGHYTATCKNTDDSWCEYNDLHIYVLNNTEPIFKKNRIAYALFYERL
jgi:ubiquitin carboxyl-terminal hydrolase 8